MLGILLCLQYVPHSVLGLEVLCIVLKRLSYPCRYLDLEGFFHRPRFELCMLFNLGVNHIDGMFSERLTNPAQPWLTIAKLHEYSAAVYAKGAPLNLCWGFIDGTVRKMCKPQVHQREVYNGHKRVHALKFQSVVTPNGLIANLFGPMPGRRHDAALLNASGLMDYMEANMNTQDGRPFCVYGDPAYPLRPHLQRPHRGQRLTAAQQQHNTDMSRVRQAVEWQFGKIVSLWAFVDFANNLKLNLSPVGKLYRLGALLTNCHACLYGNQTSDYFGLNPPSLDEYLLKTSRSCDLSIQVFTYTVTLARKNVLLAVHSHLTAIGSCHPKSALILASSI
ncbi:hypothetical protein BaRGS_00033830 [Batillaria attramentaria]|uniref:DDE Tnp4 domain-containing protein n=1 Tax=Batillaria attramentaria TaxID=370345 RepID=A0ABD0JJL3_9CAEN